MYSVNVVGITFIFTADETRHINFVGVFVTNLIFKFLIRAENIKI